MEMAMVMATARATITKEGLPLHVAAMCSAFGGATPCLHPHGHKGKCIHQRCVMGVTLQRVFLPFKGEDSWQLTMDCFFVYFLQLLFSLLNNPLFAPPALFRRSRTLSADWRSTSSTPPRTPSAYWQSTPPPIALFVKWSPAGLAMIITSMFCVDVKWQISQQTTLFPKLLLWHWQITPLSFENTLLW